METPRKSKEKKAASNESDARSAKLSRDSSDGRVSTKAAEDKIKHSLDSSTRQDGATPRGTGSGSGSSKPSKSSKQRVADAEAETYAPHITLLVSLPPAPPIFPPLTDSPPLFPLPQYTMRPCVRARTHLCALICRLICSLRSQSVDIGCTG
jgi:hypothetical protein